MTETKYCKYCGEIIHKDSIICPKCGRQVEELKASSSDQPVVINNSVSANAAASATANVISSNIAAPGKQCNKWVALLLCLFLGGTWSTQIL